MGDLKNILTHFFRNRYTRHEYFTVCREFEKETENKAFLEELEIQWNEIDTSKISDFNLQSSWNRILGKISRPDELKGSVMFWYYLQKVAAILFIPLLFASLYVHFSSKPRPEISAWAEIKCPAGVRTEFQLPDGSTGFLNSKSTLKYPVDFNHSRDVYLKGEAFFDVAKDKGSKFTVTAGELKVEVLGTSFNIMGYEDQINEEITLKTGSLKVLGSDNQQLTVLSPNQQFVLNKEQHRYTQREVNPLNYTSWIYGKLVIQDERFEDAAKKLSRWYDVEIEIDDQRIRDFKYYATFKDEPLAEVLRLIAMTAPIKYLETPRIKHADGTFSKRKIKFRTDEKRINDFK